VRCGSAGEVMKIEDGGCHGEANGGVAATSGEAVVTRCRLVMHRGGRRRDWWLGWWLPW